MDYSPYRVLNQIERKRKKREQRKRAPHLHVINCVASKNASIVKRVAETHDVPLSYTDDVVETIVSRCQELESGGRMIDAIVTNTMLPDISAEFLKRMMDGKDVAKVDIDVKDGEFVYAFE